jgi:hypothetical protein
MSCLAEKGSQRDDHGEDHNAACNGVGVGAGKCVTLYDLGILAQGAEPFPAQNQDAASTAGRRGRPSGGACSSAPVREVQGVMTGILAQN